MADRAVFLDRDGTINEEVGYLSDPEQVALLPGAADALARLKQAGFALVVVTNQSGIARGYFGEDELRGVNETLGRLLAESGAAIDAFYHCPHHPAHGEVRGCDCRKPKPGMAIRAARELGLDLARSYFVGDKQTDVELGMNAGGKPILVLTGYGREEWFLMESRGITPAGVFDSLAEAADWIIEDSKKS
ncbi:MAG: D-glycero-beta-D-manno-heptose 1,7-bisphosphate 7-phosphatase [Nitrospirae bacterium]|nr:D-glycero-beta-D-manno-heptose 1,7-bisphosphate 7-phosphatase [Nitrospirota bacterium]MBI5694801.1 D-glycero-beta-D-manno-heptose 1,7-bisphosphate 7-phosphatase [Nitrospirota bacterium]